VPEVPLYSVGGLEERRLGYLPQFAADEASAGVSDISIVFDLVL
jgi:hypothetical protein